jgi:hypothetical protein
MNNFVSHKPLFMKQSNMSLTTLFETRLAVFYAYYGFMPQLCGIITCWASALFYGTIFYNARVRLK